MDEAKLAELHQLIDKWAGHSLKTVKAEVKVERTDGKRVVRTKGTGDRVYLLDPEAKTKAWVTSPEILEELGFTMADVEDIEDAELVGYTMAASIFKVNEA